MPSKSDSVKANKFLKLEKTEKREGLINIEVKNLLFKLN